MSVSMMYYLMCIETLNKKTPLVKFAKQSASIMSKNLDLMCGAKVIQSTTCHRMNALIAKRPLRLPDMLLI